MAKHVYFFGGNKAEGSAQDKNLLGGKGANLAEMINLGIPVPPGFTISTDVCTYYYEHGKTYPKTLEDDVWDAMRRVEEVMGTKFGDQKNPLLVSVRSGSRVSMPGMMETILNVGLNDDTVEGLARKSKNPRFAYDCYRRFIQMYAGTAMHADKEAYEHAIEKLKHARGVSLDTELNTDDLKELVETFKNVTRQQTGHDFPTNPMDQLRGAVNAVFDSWMVDKARTYRKIHNIPEHWGTAVNVCAMVFGNMGDSSATGVAFTRNPSTGEAAFYGEYLPNAQGEDVVAGIRTPMPINNASAKAGEKSLEATMPKPYKELVAIYNKLERHYRDMQDIEFTIQEGKLWMLQTRSAKRTGFAAIRAAVEMVKEGLIFPLEAIKRVSPGHLQQLLAPVFHADEKAAAIKKGLRVAKGINASPGAACGIAAFSAGRAVALRREGKPSLLVRIETSPEDIAGMHAAEGILTSRGGATSHAAVVARGMGKPCVCGASDLKIDYAKGEMRVGESLLREGEYVSIDGTTGEVIITRLETEPAEVVQVLEGMLAAGESRVYPYYRQFMEWVDEARELKVRANADIPVDAKRSIKMGAEGIGLCRTEHMFFGEERIKAMREMIVADTEAERRVALAKLLPFQREDFVGLFTEMGGRPVTIRLLDPPLHEFLPHGAGQVEEIARGLGIAVDKLQAKIHSLHEFNPMLGHRGCRLGISYPEITEMQARAIFEAAAEVIAHGGGVNPEVMVPLVGDLLEFRHQRAIIDRVAQTVMKERNVFVAYTVGTMIEVPRAALTADIIAREAEFFSFGTNDLTQMTLGFSRDDSGGFIQDYMDRGIVKESPFVTIDQEGVGQLVTLAVERGRSARPGMKCGICGEHGGDPDSVMFFHTVGLDYVSCSPFRVPIARLAAAHAALKEPRSATSKALIEAGAAKASVEDAARKGAMKGASKGPSKGPSMGTSASGAKKSAAKPGGARKAAAAKKPVPPAGGGRAAASNGRRGTTAAKGKKSPARASRKR